MRRRFLRPGFLAPVGDRLWAVDQFQPVAAVLDPQAGVIERVVSWPGVPPPPAAAAPGWDGWRVLGAEHGLWVQPHQDGPVALVGEDGLICGHYSAGLRLQAVSATGSWCGTQPPGGDVLATPDAPTPRPLPATELLLLRPDGTRASLAVDRPVCSLRAGTDGMYAGVNHDPWTRRYEGGYLWVPPRDQHWIRLPTPPAGQTTEVAVDAQPSVTAPERAAWRCNGVLGTGTPWHSTPSHGPDRPPDPLVGGLRWVLGCRADHVPYLRALATGHDPVADTERRRIDLGAGDILAVAPAEPYLWITIRRADRTSLRAGAPVELTRLDTRDGHLSIVAPPDSIEITDHCWPLPAKPVDADSYSAHQRRHFAGIGTAMRPPDGGPGRPPVEGMRELHVDTVGSWPDTVLHVTFAHPEYPGLRLHKAVPVFDQLGRRAPVANVALDLVEGHDSGQWPPATDAVDGTLQL